MPQAQDVVGFSLSPTELSQSLVSRLSAAPAPSPHGRKYANFNGTEASQCGYASSEESFERSKVRAAMKMSPPIYNISPPQFALPNCLFWDMIFTHLDQADFGALAW